eukprot:6185883-Pleurochrysis_carterae.AAC.3
MASAPPELPAIQRSPSKPSSVSPPRLPVAAATAAAATTVSVAKATRPWIRPRVSGSTGDSLLV